MNHLFLIGTPGPLEIIIIVAIVLLLFGGKKIPELMRGLGQGMREFKNASKEDHSKDSDQDNPNQISDSGNK
ncbi:MAG: twin-arginine translocase TatA/TatE family subunit [Bacteroidetes bacterium]|jgi:sec-independent protein translocase protein TatA|nr:twin-arginine translocase TatA/TatE family subunit [Bacteroidota bacterium]